MDLSTLMEEIQQEAEKKRSLIDPSKRAKRPSQAFVIPIYREPFTKRLWSKLRTNPRSFIKLIYRIPFLGALFKWMTYYLRLTIHIDQLYKDLDLLRAQQDELLTMNHWLGVYREDHKAVTQYLEKLIIQDTHALRVDVEKIKNRLNSMQQSLNSLSDYSVPQTGTIVMANQDNGAVSQNLDALYVAFEDRFRASSEKIREHLKNYLHVLHKLTTDFSKNPVLDIGCGRGEWLQLLKDSGIQAEGIDLNSIWIQDLTQKGFKVKRADVSTYLAEAKNETFSAITGFHIAEHLPFPSLIRLLDDALRVLAPKGVLILETPNPENLLVGSCNFYTDPTHKNPIPPHTLAFLAEQRGFRDVEVMRFSAIQKDRSHSVPELAELIEWSKKEQDYAIIAWK